MSCDFFEINWEEEEEEEEEERRSFSICVKKEDQVKKDSVYDSKCRTDDSAWVWLLCEYKWVVCTDHKIHFVCSLHSKKSVINRLQSESVCCCFLSVDLFFDEACVKKTCCFIINAFDFSFDSDLFADSV